MAYNWNYINFDCKFSKLSNRQQVKLTLRKEAACLPHGSERPRHPPLSLEGVHAASSWPGASG